MNLRPTLWKTVLPIVIGLAVFIYLVGSLGCTGGCSYGTEFNIGFLLAIALYLLISLFQKKKVSNMPKENKKAVKSPKRKKKKANKRKRKR